MSNQRGHPDDIDDPTLRRGYQASDVKPRFVIYALLGLFGGLVVSLAAMTALSVFLERIRERPVPSALQQVPIEPAGPRLEITPEGDRAAIEARAAAQIEGYGWSDRNAARARIPIERAMQITAEKGWPSPDDLKERTP